MTIDSKGTFASQLAPLAARIRERQGLVRPISQVLLTCTSNPTIEILSGARTAVLRWVEVKAGRKIPPPAWEGEPFELAEVGAQRAEAVRFDDYWAARVDDADKGVARRTWVTEVGLGRTDDFVLFGARLFCVTRGDDPAAARSVPGFVRDVANVGDFKIDGRQVCTEPWFVNSPHEVDSLVALIQKTDRRHAICVFSLPEGSERPGETAIPVDSVLRRTTGAAHIAIISGPASYELTRKLGKEFSVFLRAVRTYRPKFDLNNSDPGDHPLALARRIENWPGGSERFGDLLVDGVLRSTVSSPDLEYTLPPYSKVKQGAQERQRMDLSDSGASDQELFELSLNENEGLRNQIEEQQATFTGLLALAEEERDVARAQLNDSQSRISALSARVEHLEERWARSGLVDQQDEIPEDFKDLAEWGRRNLAGKVVILPRAVRAANKSPFEDVSLAYSALLLLRDHYVPMKRKGDQGRLAAYKVALQELHLEEAPCFAGQGAGQEGDTYFPTFRGARRELDRHLKGSNSRDPRFGFRLYFFWDDETEQVVVGSLPNHLGTRVS